MSRKLIYVSGLLACYGCHTDFSYDQRIDVYGNVGLSPEPRNFEPKKSLVIEHLERLFAQTPLELVAGSLLRYPHLDNSARKILDSYNQFVGILAEDEKRERLDSITEEEAETDPVFQRARELSHTFRDGLLEFFFDEESGIGDLTRNYGVF